MKLLLKLCIGVSLLSVCVFAKNAYVNRTARDGSGKCANGRTPSAVVENTICPMYTENSCCTTSGDLDKVRNNFAGLTSGCTSGVKCQDSIRNLFCASCSPHSGSFFKDDKLQICSAYAKESYDACSGSLLKDPSSGQCIEGSSLFGSAESFASVFGAVSDSNCFDGTTDQGDGGDGVVVVVTILCIVIVCIIIVLIFVAIRHHSKGKKSSQGYHKPVQETYLPSDQQTSVVQPPYPGQPTASQPYPGQPQMMPGTTESAHTTTSIAKSSGSNSMVHTVDGMIDGQKPVHVTIGGKDTPLKLIKKVGKGTYASVWKAQAEDGTVYALKIVKSKKKGAVSDAQKEAMMMMLLDKRYVVTVCGCSFGSEHLSIAMEYFELGSLQNILEDYEMTPEVGIVLIHHIARAMEYLHSVNIIHRDLKPGNVLVCTLDVDAEVMCKISDFGEARGIADEQGLTMTNGVGTPFYMAPEMVTNSRHYTSAVDVYSFSIVAVQVMTGQLNYDPEAHFETPFEFVSLMSKGLRPLLGNISNDLKALITQCWDGEAEKRPSFSEVVQTLNSIRGIK